MSRGRGCEIRSDATPLALWNGGANSLVAPTGIGRQMSWLVSFERVELRRLHSLARCERPPDRRQH
jgi:hypothetical protein